MKVLIIGGAGFVGGYLGEYLSAKDDDRVFVTKVAGSEFYGRAEKVFDVDLLCRESIAKALKESEPDVIFHLAAQSSVALSWKEPALTVDVNIKGCLNLLDEVRLLDKQPRVVLIGSGEEYGPVKSEDLPIKESCALTPMNIYAATKACQNMIGKIYAKAYGMDIVMTRSFNHTGPKQSPQFVVSDFCKQIAEIEKGLKPAVIKVGNLSAKRDFTDVRDVVRAYVLLAVKGLSGEVYNVGSGRGIAIKEILDKAVSISDKDIKIEVDESKLRPVDVPLIEADINKLIRDTGWQPLITIDETIRDTLNYWRALL